MRQRAAGLGAAELGRGRPPDTRGSRRRPRHAGPTRRPPRRARSASGSSAVSEVTRAVRGAVRAGPAAGRPVGRGRDRPGHGLVAPATPTSRSRTSATSSSACGSATTGCARRSRPRPGCASSSTAGSTCSSRRARSAVRRVDPAGGVRRPRAPVRGAQGAPGRRGAVRRRRASGRCRSGRATIAVITSPTGAVWQRHRHVLARRWPLVRVVLVAAQVQGDGAPASIVDGVPPGRALRRGRAREAGRARRRAGRDDPGPRRRLARGPVGVQRRARSCGPSSRHPMPVVCGVGHEVDVTLADFAADVRAPDAVRGRGDRRARPGSRWPAALRRAGGRAWRPSRRRRLAAARELAVERRALDRLSPAARLAPAREQVGLLFDRATRAVDARLAGRSAGRRPSPCRRTGAAADDGRRLTRGRACRAGVRRVARARTRSAAALAVLGPQATLDRGYAIVRRRPDGSIVRGPGRRARPGRRSTSGSRDGDDRRDRRRPGERVGERPMEYARVRRRLVVVIAVVGDPRWYAARAAPRPADRRPTTRSRVTDTD